MSQYDCSLSDGSTTKQYLIDRESGQFRFDSIPTLRPQQDNSSSPSERSVNPEIGWLRSRESFHHGAGQTFADREDSDQYRYRTSKGLNTLERKWEATLLNGTERVKDTFLASPIFVLSGSFLGTATSRLWYFSYPSNTLVKTDDLSTYTNCTGISGTPAYSPFASSGLALYVGTSVGVFSGSNTSFSAYGTGEGVTAIGFVKGRLMAASTGGNIYNLTAAGAFPAALGSFPTISWVGFAEGPNRIYVAGNFSLYNGVIYKIGIKSDGTGLDAPVPASPGMPNGEFIHTIFNYLGFVFVATTKGVRMCDPDANGDLTIGPPIPTGVGGARGFFGEDRFIYFGWTAYDEDGDDDSGLGRLDLQNFTDVLLPAYASDVMTGHSSIGSGVFGPIYGGPRGVFRFQERLVFGFYSGDGLSDGIYAETTDEKVTSGHLKTGYITYNVSDPKAPQAITTVHRPLPAGSSIVTALAVEDGAFTTYNTQDADADPDRVPLTGISFSERVEVQTTLNRATAAADGPTLSRVTLLSEVVVQSGDFIFVPVILSEAQLLRGGYTQSFDVLAEMLQLQEWRNERTPLTFTSGSHQLDVVIRDYRFVPSHKAYDDNEQGTFQIQLKVREATEVAA